MSIIQRGKETDPFTAGLLAIVASFTYLAIST